MANMLYRNNQNSLNLQQIKQMAQSMQTNPQGTINSMIASNPQVMNKIQALLNSGQNPKNICLQELAQRGIDITSILNSLK